jgi:hypothetical protein
LRSAAEGISWLRLSALLGAALAVVVTAVIAHGDGNHAASHRNA